MPGRTRDEDRRAASFGRILGASWRVFRARPWTFVAIQIAAAAPFLVLPVVLFLRTTDASKPTSAALPDAWEWIAVLVGCVSMATAQASVAWLARGTSQGTHVRILDAVGIGVRRAPRLVAVGLVVAVVFWLFAVVWTAIVALAANGLGTPGDVTAARAAVVVGAAVAAGIGGVAVSRLWLVVPIVVFERLALRSIGRSWSLTRGHRLSMLLLLLAVLLYLVAAALVPVLGVVLVATVWPAFAGIVPTIAYETIRRATGDTLRDEVAVVFD